MTKIIIMMIGLFLSFHSYSQQVTWQCTNVIVDNPSAFMSVWNDFMDSDTENFSDTLNKTESENIIKIVQNIEFQSDNDKIAEDFDIYLTTDEDIETDILFLSDDD